MGMAAARFGSSVMIEHVAWPRLLAPPAPVSGDGLRYSLSAESGVAQALVAGDWAAARGFSDLAAIPPVQLYGPVHAAIGAADLSLVNLEMPIVRDRPIIKDGPNFGGDPTLAEVLARAGWDAVSLANNHLRDQGDAAVAGTIAACRAAGLKTVGGGADRTAALEPLVIERRGLRIGLLALAEPGDAVATARHGGAADITDPMVPVAMADLRRRCDVVLVVAHGGVEYAPLPPPYWVDRLTALVALGADGVIAHHPHVPQGMSLVERPGRAPAPIVWSLGNFIFPPRPPDQQKPPHMDWGFVARLDLAVGQVTTVELVPYRIHDGVGLSAIDRDGCERRARFVATLGGLLTDRDAYEVWCDQFALRSWRVHACERVRGLTAKLCAGEPEGLRHAQSHFLSPAHYALYGRAVQCQAEGVAEDAAIQALIERWYQGTWPD